MEPTLNRARPEHKTFAERLLSYEVADKSRADAHASPLFRLFAKLRPPLCKIMGIAGYRALLSRALALAGKEVPWLRRLTLHSNGMLEAFNSLHTELQPPELTAGEIALVARFLQLLITFIGPELTVGLVHEVWPDGYFDDLPL